MGVNGDVGGSVGLNYGAGLFGVGFNSTLELR